MKEIRLSKGKFTIVDDSNYEWLVTMGKWHCTAQGYAAINISKPCGKRTTITMHRVLMNKFNSDYESIDHINLNKTDNRIENLRICNKSKNMMNKGALRNNKSGYKGVHFDKSRLKYKVDIGFDGKRKCIGRYSDIIEAARAYNTAALKYHGEFACLNDV